MSNIAEIIRIIDNIIIINNNKKYAEANENNTSI